MQESVRSQFFDFWIFCLKMFDLNFEKFVLVVPQLLLKFYKFINTQEVGPPPDPSRTHNYKSDTRSDTVYFNVTCWNAVLYKKGLAWAGNYQKCCRTYNELIFMHMHALLPPRLDITRYFQKQWYSPLEALQHMQVRDMI